MSKVIEKLNNPFKKERLRSSAQEEIARMYLKVSDKSKNKLPKPKAKLPWAIALVAIFFAILTLLFKSNIDVKVRILGEIPSIGPSETTDKFGSLKEKGLYLVKGSEPNRYLIKGVDFAGDAKIFSRAASGELILCNSRGNGWANYEIKLKEPIDLSKLDVKYAARGERGEEYLTVVVVDSGNRAYRMEQDMSSKLAKEWQTYIVNFKPIKRAVNLSEISTIRFEFGGLTAGNSPMATIFLKDIRVTKTKKVEL
jgi:hypothetical protein